jgi:hypothetical protein
MQIQQLGVDFCLFSQGISFLRGHHRNPNA